MLVLEVTVDNGGGAAFVPKGRFSGRARWSQERGVAVGTKEGHPALPWGIGKSLRVSDPRARGGEAVGLAEEGGRGAGVFQAVGAACADSGR